MFNRAGIPVAVVTNQAGVARGLTGSTTSSMCTSTSPSVWLITERTSTCFCTAHITPRESSRPSPAPARTVSRGRAWRRRPQAALNLDLTASWVVGDRPEDVGLAEAIGASAIYLGPEDCDRPGVWSFPSLAAAAPFILERIAV